MASSSSSLIPASNLSCARCHNSEYHLGQRFLSCTGCKSVKYCSKDCQGNACPGHKGPCRSIRNGTPPDQAFSQASSRATMRLNHGRFMQQRANEAAAVSVLLHATLMYATPCRLCPRCLQLHQDRNTRGNDMIYYLLTSVHHRHDISAAGPYHSTTPCPTRCYTTSAVHTAG